MLKLEEQAELLISRVKHYLITNMGRLLSEASTSEVYCALSYALREELMVSWMTSKRTFHKFETRRLYYLSMEFLPGRILGNTVTNLHANPLLRQVIQRLGLQLQELIHCEGDPGLGNGGLGRLASCFMDSLATQHYPAMGYGLRYQYGMFEQEIWGGIQVERPDCWLLNENPWERRQDPHRRTVKFGGIMETLPNRHEEEDHHLNDYDEVRALPYDLPILGYSVSQRPSVLTLRLWTTKESPRNFQLQRYNAGRLDQAAENTALTDVLYPVDEHDVGRRVRIKQEFLLVSATLQDILEDYTRHHCDFGSFANKVRIQINDTHPALVVAELVRLLTHRYNLRWGEACEICRHCCSYTNHTILREAMEQWGRNLLEHLLPRQYRIIERMNADFLGEVRQRFPDDEDKVRRLSILENGTVRMAHLAIYGSHKVNGVAKLHTEILKSQVFKDFADLYPDRFMAITNGVTQRRWLLHCNPLLSQLISERITDAWIKDFSQLKKLSDFASDKVTQDNFLEIKRANKAALVDWLRENHVIRDERGIPHHDPLEVDPDALFDVQIKRFHEYKRQLLNALHLILLYQELKDKPDSRQVKRVSIIGGKAAAGYIAAKTVIQPLCPPG